VHEPALARDLVKPACALKVAVVGNRRFAGESHDHPNPAAERMKVQAARACAEVWQIVVESMQSALQARVQTAHADHGRLADFFGGPAPALTVLSSLAAGADQIGAHTALDAARAGGVSVQLEAVLPFPTEDYPGLPGKLRPEFRPDEAEALEQLAGRARQVIRLDGRYENEERRRQAYDHAREILMQHADLLVAIYDPLAVGAPAGTRETVTIALERFLLPVVVVLTAEREARIAVYASIEDRPTTGEEEWQRASPPGDGRWRGELRHHVARLISLPHQLEAADESGPGRARRGESLTEAVEGLRLMYGEAPLHRMCRDRRLTRIFAAAWWSVLSLGAACGGRYAFAEETHRPEAARDAITIEPYAACYARASLLSDSYMRTYRGAFVLSFALAGLAVSAAVTLMMVSLLTDGDPPLAAVLAMGSLKVAIIVALLLLQRSSHHGRYQEHAADFRYLAELARPMQWLAPVAMTVPLVPLPVHSAPLDPRRGWTRWLFRATARATPLVALPATADRPASPPHVGLDAGVARAALERAASEWLQGQRRYHYDNAVRMHAIDAGLEHLAQILVWIVLGCAGLALVLEVFEIHRLHAAAIVLGTCAAALPAFVAALGGIMFQSEAKRLRLRSEAMHLDLAHQQDRLRAQLAAIRDARGGVAWDVAKRLGELSKVTIGEAGDWKVLYQTHEVHAG
jgi:hypothetical protein